MLFIAGKNRTASQASSFHFHQTAWTFSSLTQQIGVISDAYKWLNRYEDMMADNVAAASNLQKNDVLKMMRDGVSLTPDEAQKMKLIEQIADHDYPRDAARSWQI